MMRASEKCRLAGLEAELRESDPGYVARFEAATAAMLPAGPAADRGNSGTGVGTGARTAGRLHPLAPISQQTERKRAGRWHVTGGPLRWRQVLAGATVSALLGIGLAASTTAGTVTFLVLAAVLMVAVGYRPARRVLGRDPRRGMDTVAGVSAATGPHGFRRGSCVRRWGGLRRGEAPAAENRRH